MPCKHDKTFCECDLDPVTEYEEKYVEYDGSIDMICIFGTETGNCYGTFLDEELAEKHLEEMNNR